MPGVAILGVSGRMGQALLRALREEAAGAPPQDAWVLSGALVSPASSQVGLDASADATLCGVRNVAEPAAALARAAVAVDFSAAAGVADHARACATLGIPLLVGTTGFDAATRADLEAAARAIPVLIAANTSIGVTLLAHLVRRATRALGDSFDVEISEVHHRHKRDAPSGTALHLGEVVAAARGVALADVAVAYGADSAGPRPAGAIGFAVSRAGDVVGEHTVTLAGSGERLELTHRATDRMTFARGALRAARWLSSRPPGLYRMDHALGLEEA